MTIKDIINILKIDKIYSYFNEIVKYIAQIRISNESRMKIKSQYITVFHRMHQQLIKSNIDQDFMRKSHISIEYMLYRSENIL